VLLVVSELFSNAVDATDDMSEVSVRIKSERKVLSIAVSNHGRAFELINVPAPLENQKRGRGLALAQQLGTVSVENADKQTTVKVEMTEIF
jgi:anti-sigma regulatory factor (Ser/Thr protein kinase)